MTVIREPAAETPLPAQYAIFLRNVMRGDFGRSIHFRQPAMDVARSYLRATFELGLVAFAIAGVVAFPIGVLSAVRRNSPLDHAAMGLALIGQSAPTFFIGILLILILALRFDLFPTSGRGDWRHLVLPALTLGAFTMASIARITRWKRSSMAGAWSGVWIFTSTPAEKALSPLAVMIAAATAGSRATSATAVSSASIIAKSMTWSGGRSSVIRATRPSSARRSVRPPGGAWGRAADIARP